MSKQRTYKGWMLVLKHTGHPIWFTLAGTRKAAMHEAFSGVSWEELQEGGYQVVRATVTYDVS